LKYPRPVIINSLFERKWSGHHEPRVFALHSKYDNFDSTSILSDNLFKS